MNKPSREDLLGYLLGALDAQEQAQVENYLLSNPEIEAQLHELKACMAPLSARSEFHDVPVGLARRTCEHVARYVRDPSYRTSLESPSTPTPPQPTRRFTVGYLALLIVGSLAITSAGIPALQHSRLAQQQVPQPTIISDESAAFTPAAIATTQHPWAAEPAPLFPLPEPTHALGSVGSYQPGSIGRLLANWKLTDSTFESTVDSALPPLPQPAPPVADRLTASSPTIVSRSNPLRPTLSETAFRLSGSQSDSIDRQLFLTISEDQLNFIHANRFGQSLGSGEIPIINIPQQSYGRPQMSTTRNGFEPPIRFANSSGYRFQ